MTRLSNNRGNPQVESTDAIAANAIACDYVDIVRLEGRVFRVDGPMSCLDRWQLSVTPWAWDVHLPRGCPSPGCIPVMPSPLPCGPWFPGFGFCLPGPS